VTLLKYVVAAVLFLAAGPMAMKFLFGNRSTDEFVDTAVGMPVAPDNKREVHIFSCKT